MKRDDPVLVWMGLVVLLFADLLFLPVMIYGRDVNSYFLPLESAVHHAWTSGHLPLWFAGVSGGKPLLPNPNAGAFYPLRMLAAVLPFFFGFKLYLVFHLFLAGWGAIRLARAFGIGRGGQAVAAITYALSGPTVSAILFSNMLPGLALFPWIALAGYRLARRPTPRRAAVVSMLLTLDIFGGEPFTIVLALLALGAFAFTASPDCRPRALAGSVAASATAAVAAGLQLIPMLLYLPETFRAQVRFRLAATLQWSLSPARLFEWIVPYPFGDPTRFVAWKTWGGRFFDGRPSGYFATIFAGAFAAAALIRPSVRFAEPRIRRALGLLAGLSLVLSCAAVFVPGRLLALPTRLALRYPEKFIFGVTLVMALYAARGWEKARESARFARPLWIVSGALALAGATAFLTSDALARWVLAWARDGRASVATVGSGLPRSLFEASLHWGIAALAATLLAAFPGRRRATAAAFLLLAADMGLATRRVVRTASDRDVLDPPPAIAALRALDPDTRFCFVPQSNYFPIPAPLDAARAREPDRPPEITLRAFAGSMWGRPSVLNSDPDASDLARHALARRDFFVELGKFPARAANLLEGYSVAYLVRFSDATPLPGAVPAAAAGAVVIDRLPGAVPRFSIASGWKEFRSREEAEAALSDSAIPPTTAVLETGRRGSGETPSGKIEFLDERPDGFDAVATCPGGCWLRATRGFWKFRDVRVDGIPGDVVPERVALSAVRIPPGRHTVIWRERMPGGMWGAAASALGFAAIGLAAAISRPRRSGQLIRGPGRADDRSGHRSSLE